MTDTQSAPATEAVNYKDTLNLPQTDFKMKAGAATREPEIEAFWAENQVYEKAQAARKAAQKDKFVLHDGPPYLSSDKIHIGTALNKILKDIVTRYKYQRGYFAPYIPGYDSHGLPIENAVVKNIKGGRAALTEVELRKKCREFALGNLTGQETNFKRLGIWGDWAHPYVTLHAQFEATQAQKLGTMYEKGYVYKGLKPVYWCPHCETALADAEVEYDNHTSHSVYVAFPVQDAKFDGDANIVIWTTTPWTLPANLALSVHPDFEYSLIKTATFGKLLVAKELLAKFAEQIKLENYKELKTFKGADLEGILAKHPFIDRTSRTLTGTHVTLDAGTGIVHTAPGHGMEDYIVVQEYNKNKADDQKIPILSPVDSQGKYTAEAIVPELIGQFYEKANEPIIEILKSKNALLGHAKFDHSYPHCWRCHHPVIYRATEQWFIDINKIRQPALDAIKTVAWVPEKGESRITSMVEGRGDWCISRQRVWGVPIPVFYCGDPNCRTEIINEQTSQRVYELFCEGTSDVWWELSADEILKGLDLKCGCGSTHFEKETDIMDVWFDSGMTHTTVVEARAEEFTSRPDQQALPVELYLEGSDQHRGWFQSSLLTSVMLNGKAPYKGVLTHGFVLDQNGRKMSKSLGNVVDPNKIMNQYGADILRLWVASVDYTVDIRIGDTILAQLAETYKKVRNTFRFMLGNLSDFNPKTDRVTDAQLSHLDRYVLHRLQGLIQRVTADFDKFEFHRYNHEIQYFCNSDLSSLYFDVAKDILYCDAKASPRRRAIQTVLHETLITLLPMLVPIMPHLAEDIWQNLPEPLKVTLTADTPLSITMADWPEVKSQYFSETVQATAEKILELKTQVNLTLETPRSQGLIGSSLEAAIWLAKSDVRDALTPTEWEAFLITSKVEFVDALPDLSANAWQQQNELIAASAANANKCQRCWRLTAEVGTFADHPALCARCHEAVV